VANVSSTRKCASTDLEHVMQHQRLMLRSHRLLLTAGFACACIATARTLQAQARHTRVQLRAGGAVALARTSVGGATSTDVGPLLSAQLGFAVSHGNYLTLGAGFQPFKAHNPVADEAFTAVHTVAGVQLALGKARRFYLRPEVGAVFRSWSGSEVFVASETSLAVGLAFGREWPVGRKMGLALEGFARFSGADELSTTLMGLGLSFIPFGARR
jgi:hypothetical protein